MGKRLWLGLVLCGLWESGLMDVFFEAGHIVSNAPALRLDRKPAEAFPEAARPELNEAIAGGGGVFYPCHARLRGSGNGEYPETPAYFPAPVSNQSP